MLYDVSLTLAPELVSWPGDPEIEITPISRADGQGSAGISRLTLGSHSGSHIDAPCHFIPDAPGIDGLDPAILIGPARVFQLPTANVLEVTVLRDLNLDGVSRVVFGTRNSALLRRGEFSTDYACLTPEAADYIISKGIKLIGIDHLSVEAPDAPGQPVHRALLEAGVIIVEGLDLSGVPAGDYEIMALPLKIKDADGAPARVLLKTITEGEAA